jgi:hypothetical protein
MRRSLAKFSESEASNHTPSLAGFIITMSGFKFSVHTGPRSGRATTSDAVRLRRAGPGRPHGTSFCRYRCQRRKSTYSFAGTWRAPRLWRPLPASIAGGAGARPDHPKEAASEGLDDRRCRRLGIGISRCRLGFAPQTIKCRLGEGARQRAIARHHLPLWLQFCACAP